MKMLINAIALMKQVIVYGGKLHSPSTRATTWWILVDLKIVNGRR
jgi:hypothetical protein